MCPGAHSGAWKWDRSRVSPTPLPSLGGTPRKSDPRALRSPQRSGLCSDSQVPLPFLEPGGLSRGFLEPLRLQLAQVKGQAAVSELGGEGTFAGP